MLTRERCVWCNERTRDGAWLCKTCGLALSKYPSQNEVIIVAYVEAGFEEMIRVLCLHSAFYAWEAARARQSSV